jgi:hypothetical protein
VKFLRLLIIVLLLAGMRGLEGMDSQAYEILQPADSEMLRTFESELNERIADESCAFLATGVYFDDDCLNFGHIIEGEGEEIPVKAHLTAIIEAAIAAGITKISFAGADWLDELPEDLTDVDGLWRLVQFDITETRLDERMLAYLENEIRKYKQFEGREDCDLTKLNRLIEDLNGKFEEYLELRNKTSSTPGNTHNALLLINLIHLVSFEQSYLDGEMALGHRNLSLSPLYSSFRYEPLFGGKSLVDMYEAAWGTGSVGGDEAQIEPMLDDEDLQEYNSGVSSVGAEDEEDFVDLDPVDDGQRHWFPLQRVALVSDGERDNESVVANPVGTKRRVDAETQAIEQKDVATMTGVDEDIAVGDQIVVPYETKALEILKDKLLTLAGELAGA